MQSDKKVTKKLYGTLLLNFECSFKRIGAKTGSEMAAKKREDSQQLQQNHMNGAQSTSGKCKWNGKFSSNSFVFLLVNGGVQIQNRAPDVGLKPPLVSTVNRQTAKEESSDSSSSESSSSESSSSDSSDSESG